MALNLGSSNLELKAVATDYSNKSAVSSSIENPTESLMSFE